MTTSSSRRDWLDQDELDTWMRLFVLAAAAQTRLDGQLRGSEGITRFEFYVLAVLDEQNGVAPTMGDLARALHCTPSHLSHTVRKLESTGWVQRERTPGNARTASVRLTESGLQRLREAAPGHVKAIRELIFDHLTRSQTEAFAEALERITTALTAEETGAAEGVQGRCRALLGRTGGSSELSQHTVTSD